jgi:hypothetical protein
LENPNIAVEGAADKKIATVSIVWGTRAGEVIE